MASWPRVNQSPAALLQDLGKGQVHGADDGGAEKVQEKEFFVGLIIGCKFF